MSGGFIDIARGRLNLAAEQLDFIRGGAVGSFDELHAVLRASPSLANEAWLAAGKLLALMENEGLLSARYLERLKAPPVVLPPPAAAAPRRPEPGEQVIAPPQRPLPGAGLPPSLADAPARLQLLDGGVLRRWPVRNQDVHPMGCIGFATAAAVERLRMPPGGAPPELSSVFIYKRVFALFPQGNRQIQRPPGAVDGPTKFGEACAVLATDGVCPRPAWPDDAPVNRLPDAAALQAAKQSPPVAFDHWDLPPNGKRPPGVARAIHTLLDSGRAVGVALPEFKDRLSQDNMTNWRLPSNYAIGKVGEQQLGWERTNAGHAVCILGFRPDAGAPGGGWFIFRNSWGLVYAKDAPDADDPAGVPAPGYGAMSAGHADAHVWEMFSPKSP